VNHYNPKVVRAAMGAHFRLPIYSGKSWPEISADLQAWGLPPSHVFATDVEASRTYDAVNWVEPSALVVSNEAHGLSADAAALAGGGPLTIPMQGSTESLNASIAAAVVLFEAARQRRIATKDRA
jgi:TrmH family RNA methyltransferase